MEIPGYEIKRRIGQGGMATAYLAEQRSLGRQVVLKVLDSKVHGAPETIERFLNEGRIIASLNHPHIITIYDIGQNGEDVYISMEYVEGGDLKERMMGRVFAPIEAIDVVEKIASGLAVAHDNGIVHRDVKPGNILFRGDGTPLLSDFGIAKRLSGDSDLTSTGMFLGSPNYMAPEQSEAGPIDGRADIYALGVIFYEMLSGERAYSADSVIDVIVMHKTAPVPRLPAGFEAFQELLNLMMAKDRRERFRDAKALAHFVQELKKSGEVRSKPEMTARPDIDITGEHGEVSAEVAVKRTRLEARKLAPMQILMIAMLVVCLLAWAGLLIFERSITASPLQQVEIAARLDTINAEHGSVSTSAQHLSDAQREQIGEALLWLGHHSLEQLKLTAPPRDNAYYYFSRLAELDPGNPHAQSGLRNLATQFALLAERDIANNRYDEALAYIRVGQEIDPANESLRVLKELAEKPKIGFWGALGSLFK